MWRITALCIVTMSLVAAKVTYKDYRLFSIVPTTHSQLQVLQFLRNWNGFSYWQEPSWINNEVLLMVSPHNLTDFKYIMNNIPYKLKIDDVQKLIDNSISRKPSRYFNFNSYHNISVIYNYLDYLHAMYPKQVKMVELCCSYNNYHLKGVKISPTNSTSKPGIFLEGGMHGRDWLSPATVIYIINQLLFSENPRLRKIANSHNWIIFPVLNPDGYEYSHTHDRLWSKTRKPSSPTCYGTDLNRNWNFKWNTIGTSNNPCDDNYPGNKQFSEPEINVLAEYLHNITIHAYISFQSFGQKLMVPYSHTIDQFYSYDWLLQISKAAINHIKHKYNTEYQFGSISELDGLAGGTSADYAAKMLFQQLVFVYKLRDDGEFGFLVPPEQIIPSGEEALEFLISVLTKALENP